MKFIPGIKSCYEKYLQTAWSLIMYILVLELKMNQLTVNLKSKRQLQDNKEHNKNTIDDLTKDINKNQ